MAKASFAYVTYIGATPARVWKALVDPETTAKYWQHTNESDWRKGSAWRHVRTDARGTVDLEGKVLGIEPPKRLVLSWAFPGDLSRKERVSRVTFQIEPYRKGACLTVTHDRLQPRSDMLEGITDGWPKVLSSLKTLLETGKPLPKLW